MAQQLTDMVIEEISLVDDGANQHADVVICKVRSPEGGSGSTPRQQEQMMDIETLAKSLEDAEAKMGEFEARVTKAEQTATQAAADLAAAKDVIKAKDAELAALKDEVEKAKCATKKADGKNPDGSNCEDESMEDESSEEDQVKKALAALPEAIRKRIEATEARAIAAEAEVQKARDKAELDESIAKAKQAGLPRPEDTGPMVLRLRKSKVSEADIQLVEGLLKAAAAQTTTAALFKSLGSSQAADGDPATLLQAKADEIQKANPKLSAAQAYSQATEENPGLYNQYISKRRTPV